MTTTQKTEIADLIKEQISLLGSFRAVANKAGCSDATVSQIVNNNWVLIADRMWLKIAGNLGWKKTGWQIVETTNTKTILQVFQDAKDHGIWMAISDVAGSGKTESCNIFEGYKTAGVYVIRCWEWGKRAFLKEFNRMLGMSERRGYVDSNDLMRDIVDYFKQRVHLKPLLIIDEADKLRPGALRNLIPLYNELEGSLGVVILGTENLRKEIKRGVSFSVKGYDEIDSRFGRNFIKLIGATKTDVTAICNQNGITDKKTQTDIFNESIPRQRLIGGRSIMVVEDLRRVKRAVQRELMKQQELHESKELISSNL